jgi:glucose-6-phosphate 1-dehydrogenase
MPQKPDTVAAPPTRLLVLDVDGTVTNSRHEVTTATCEAVARIRAAGIRVVLATGRRYRDTLPVAARLGISGPLITASGALVKRTTDHATLARAEFGPGTLEGVVAEIVAAGHEPVLDWLRALPPEDRRVIGTDLATAEALNAQIHTVFRESQVYRIDHYLGKESVQNILALRFANTIFEPVWNRRYIDHVQITVAEEVPVGRRAAYYETSGVLRDMFQNHLLQLLMVSAMEAPSRFNARAVRNEKVKVLEAIRPLDPGDVATACIRGQYRGYLAEPGVAPQSRTATFGAIRLEIDNWRWQGVPFYLRSGKAMSCRTTQIVIAFRQPPLELFANGMRAGNREANRLVIQIQPAEGIQLHFQTKVPGAGMRLRMTDLEFSYSREFHGRLPEAYEPLLLDVMSGDASLFARSDEVEKSWEIIDPFVRAWSSAEMPPVDLYEPGDWGPRSSFEWMASQGRTWFDACPVLT